MAEIKELKVSRRDVHERIKIVKSEIQAELKGIADRRNYIKTCREELKELRHELGFLRVEIKQARTEAKHVSVAA